MISFLMFFLLQRYKISLEDTHVHVLTQSSFLLILSPHFAHCTFSQNSWRFEEFSRNNLKYEALRGISDLSILDKQGLTWKIFSSVLYALAKSIAVHCRLKVKAEISWLLDRCFTEWWNNTPNLWVFHDQGHQVNHGGIQMKFKTYARNRIRSILSVMLKKQK